MTDAHSTSQPTLDEVLILGKDLSLSLTHNALQVKDKTQAKKQRQTVCGVSLGGTLSDLEIPFYNILWAQLADQSLIIDYAKHTSKKHLCATKLSYDIGSLPVASVEAWIEALLAKAYGSAQRQKRAKVLVNPHAGPGGADKIWEHDVKPLFEAARMSLDVVRTKYSGEAIDICQQLDIDAYDIVVPCSGDGLPYEVFNGLGQRPDARKALHQLAVAHIPCGSGNAMSCNLNGTHLPSLAALAIIKGVRMPMDLMSVTQGAKRMLSFLTQSVGIIAEADLGTENMRWLGAARFDIGVTTRVFSKKVYPCDISIKVEIQDKAQVKAHYGREQGQNGLGQRREAQSSERSSTTDLDIGEGLPPLRYGTVNDKLPDDWETTSRDKLGNFYCGNMAWVAPDANFFPAACPNDGLMDVVVNDGNLSAVKYVELLTSTGSGRFFDNPHMSYRKVVAYRFTPRDQKDGYISIDGERVAFEPFQVEIHQGLGTVISKSGKYEAPGPLDWEKVAA
ncbi:diacylglycerol kinase catalytic domain-containing protein [Xylariomycetidae sp. FL2044]|nr:diacylglycerol kinase catalytic domain-containing protein [Xylariomycetidae sp. FL2044]